MHGQHLILSRAISDSFHTSSVRIFPSVSLNGLSIRLFFLEFSMLKLYSRQQDLKGILFSSDLPRMGDL